MVRTRSHLEKLSKEELIKETRRNCNKLLIEKDVQLERNAVNNAQYHWQELMEVNHVPPSISDEEFKLNIRKVLSLTGHEMT